MIKYEEYIKYMEQESANPREIYLTQKEIRNRMKEFSELFNKSLCDESEKCEDCKEKICRKIYKFKELQKDFEKYYSIGLDKYAKEETAYFNIKKNVADLYSFMIAMMESDNNLISKKNKKLLSNVKIYSQEIFQVIENLPAFIASYIKSQPCYEYNYYLSQYIDLIIERLSVLSQTIMNINYATIDGLDIFSNIILILDSTIDKIFNIKIEAEREPTNYSENKFFYIDTLFADIFKYLEKNSLPDINSTDPLEKFLDSHADSNRITIPSELLNTSDDVYDYSEFDFLPKLLALENIHSSPYSEPFNKTSIMRDICRILDKLLINSDNHPKFYRECFSEEFQRIFHYDENYKEYIKYKSMKSFDPQGLYEYMEIVNFIVANKEIIDSGLENTQPQRLIEYLTQEFYELRKTRKDELQAKKIQQQDELTQILFLLVLEKSYDYFQTNYLNNEKNVEYYKFICSILNIPNNENSETIIDTESVEKTIQIVEDYLVELEILKNNNQFLSDLYIYILYDYANEIIESCMNTSNFQSNDIRNKVISCAETFLKEIFFKDNDRKISLYNEYRNSKEYNDIADEYLGVIFYNNASKEMNKQKYVPESIFNADENISSYHEKDKYSELLSLIERPCETKEDLNNFIKDIYKYKAESIAKSEAENFYGIQSEKIYKSGVYETAINTEFGTIKISIPKYRIKFKSKFLESFPKRLFDKELLLLEKNGFTVEQITKINEIFSEQRNIKAEGKSTVGTFLKQNRNKN